MNTLDTFHYLLSTAIDVNLPAEGGLTALTAAITWRREDVIVELLKRGAVPSDFDINPVKDPQLASEKIRDLVLDARNKKETNTKPSKLVKIHARQHIASSTSITAVLNKEMLSLWSKHFSNGAVSAQSIRIPNATLVAVGSERLIAYTKDGGIWAWGRVGVKTHFAAPERVGDIPNVTDLSTRGFNGLVLLESGTVLEWTGFKFIKIPHFDNLAAISAGKFHSLFLDRQGDVWLINTQSDRKNVPVKIAADIKQISAGDEHSLLLRKDGKVFAFGKNRHGQLGDGSFASADKPIECLIPGSFSIDQVVAGSDFSLALTGDGKVLGWGRNDRGQLGLGNFRNRNSPQLIIGINEIVELSAGEFNAFGLSKDNRIFFWGENPDGYIPGAVNGVTSIPKEIRMVY